MAAWLESPDHLVVDLRKVSAADLRPCWRKKRRCGRPALDWDFEPSAELVRRFVGMQALNGFALLEGARTIGYCYYIREEKKGLIGDLVRARTRAHGGARKCPDRGDAGSTVALPRRASRRSAVVAARVAAGAQAAVALRFRSYPQAISGGARRAGVDALGRTELEGIEHHALDRGAAGRFGAAGGGGLSRAR